MSKYKTNQPKTINKMSKTQKSQNQANWLLKYAIRNKLRHESNAAYQISPEPILDTNGYAKKEVGGRGGAYKYIYIYTKRYIIIYTCTCTYSTHAYVHIYIYICIYITKKNDPSTKPQTTFWVAIQKAFRMHPGGTYINL